MSLKLVLTINAIVALAFALSFLIMPEQMLAQYGGTDLSLDAITNIQWFGSAIIGYAALSWLARDLPASDARRVLITGLVVSWVSSLVMGLFVVLTGRVNAMGWSTVVISLFFIVGLGLHLRPASASAPSAAK